MRFKDIIRIIFFSTKTEGGEISFLKGASYFLLVCLIFVIPYDFSITIQELTAALIKNFIMVFVMFFVVMALIFGTIKLLKGDARFERFFSNVNFYLGISLILISVPAFIIALSVAKIFQNTTINLFLFSMIPYYTYVLFGWLCERNSNLSGWKSGVVAFVAMTLIYLFHFSLKKIAF